MAQLLQVANSYTTAKAIVIVFTYRFNSVLLYSYIVPVWTIQYYSCRSHQFSVEPDDSSGCSTFGGFLYFYTECNISGFSSFKGCRNWTWNMYHIPWKPIFPKSTSYTILYSLIFIWNIPLDKILYSLSMHVSKKYMWEFKGHQKCMLLEFTTGEFERTPHWKKFQLCMHTDNIREYFLRRNNLDPQ